MIAQIKIDIQEVEIHKPFVGKSDLDYYRGQWDALVYVLEELLGEDYS